MKEDVLEQIVDDYLQMQGYFTTHNVRFNPPRDQYYASQTDSVPSDIDVVGLHSRRTGTERVMVVSCKSWQSGFAASHILAQLHGEAKNPKRPRELQFRELWMPRWAHGFREKIEAITGEREFTYCLAVTRLQGDASAWSGDPTHPRMPRREPFPVPHTGGHVGRRPAYGHDYVGRQRDGTPGAVAQGSRTDRANANLTTIRAAARDRR